ncbi:MAG: substrate-binding domain-containing protein [Oscillospiraceae bacterium]|nr:substrate-binding domain-containing protein [Oscillospiraceae bacterium]
MAFLIGFSGVVIAKANISAIAAAEEERHIIVAFAGADENVKWGQANRRLYQKAFTQKENFLFKFSDAKGDDVRQKAQAENFIFLNVDYLIINPISPDGWEKVLYSALSKKIPVFFAGGNVNVSDPELYAQTVFSDYEQDGESAATWLQKELLTNQKLKEKDKINVFNITDSDVFKCEQRSQGFKNALEKTDNIVFYEEHGRGTADIAKRAANYILADHENIDVIICQSDAMLPGIAEALAAAGITTGENGDTILISYDGTQKAFEMLIDGTLNVSIEKTPDYTAVIKKSIEQLLQDPQAKLEKSVLLSDNMFLPATAEIDSVGRWY